MTHSFPTRRSSDLRDIGARFGAVDLAILPIGAYDPRWFMAAQHCDPEEAIRIMLDVGAKSALGMHWGTFKLTDEGRVDPERRLAEGLAARALGRASCRERVGPYG